MALSSLREMEKNTIRRRCHVYDTDTPSSGLSRGHGTHAGYEYS